MKPRNLVALAHVKDVAASIAFYRHLGFEVGNVQSNEEGGPPTWAWLQSNNASLMVARAGDPVIPAQQAVLFYLYYDDVEATRKAMVEAGLPAGPMTYPFYCPKGEFPLTDPDGYRVMVTHT